MQSDGSVTAFGSAPAVDGLARSRALRPPIVAATAVNGGLGLLLTDAHGQVVALGAARELGSMPGTSNARIVGIVASPSEQGYTLVSQSGIDYRFGDARGYVARVTAAQAKRPFGQVSAVAG